MVVRQVILGPNSSTLLRPRDSYYYPNLQVPHKGEGSLILRSMYPVSKCTVVCEMCAILCAGVPFRFHIESVSRNPEKVSCSDAPRRPGYTRGFAEYGMKQHQREAGNGAKATRRINNLNLPKTLGVPPAELSAGTSWSRPDRHAGALCGLALLARYKQKQKHTSSKVRHLQPLDAYLRLPTQPSTPHPRSPYILAHPFPPTFPRMSAFPFRSPFVRWRYGCQGRR